MAERTSYRFRPLGGVQYRPTHSLLFYPLITCFFHFFFFSFPFVLKIKFVFCNTTTALLSTVFRVLTFTGAVSRLTFSISITEMINIVDQLDTIKPFAGRVLHRSMYSLPATWITENFYYLMLFCFSSNWDYYRAYASKPQHTGKCIYLTYAVVKPTTST